MQPYNLRLASEADIPAITRLYQAAAAGGGLARRPEEITAAYVADFVNPALLRGLILVLTPAEAPDRVVAEMHGYPLGIRIFAHVLEQVTMAVHPQYQGRGLGRQLLQGFQDYLREHRPDLMKIELKCFSHNQAALSLYHRQGFIEEGRQCNRVRLGPGQYADGVALAWFNPGFKEQ